MVVVVVWGEGGGLCVGGGRRSAHVITLTDAYSPRLSPMPDLSAEGDVRHFFQSVRAGR